MATGAQIFQMLQQGRQAYDRRQEQDYIDERRAIEDPIKDRELNRVDAARNAIVDTYGTMAGDPSSYASVQETDEQVQKLPGELANQDLDTRIRQFALDERINQRSLGAMGSYMQSLKGARQRGLTYEDAAKQIPQAAKDALGLTPEDEAQIIQALDANPGAEDQFMQLFQDPEQFAQFMEFAGPDGKPMYYSVTNRGTATPTDLRPVQEDTRLLEAQIDAQRALAEQRRASAAGKGGDEEAANEAALLPDRFDRVWNALNRAAEGGAYASSGDQDDIRRTWRGIGASDVGRFIGGLTGSERENLRDDVDAAVSELRMLFINNPNITSRMFDTPAEQEALMKQLEGGSSIESKIRAIQETENRFRRSYGLGASERQSGGSNEGGGNLADASDDDLFAILGGN